MSPRHVRATLLAHWLAPVLVTAAILVLGASHVAMRWSAWWQWWVAP